MTIPFMWFLQPAFDPADWCTCKRCKKALKALALHVAVRSMGNQPLVYIEERI